MPDVGEGVDHRVTPFGAERFSPEQRRDGAEDFDLGFELPDALFAFGNCADSCCREARPFAPVDLVVAPTCGARRR